MRILVLTQAVDTEDRALGFFHTWLSSLAAHAEMLDVVCLKEGSHSLPHNIRVHSLGKERGYGVVRYIANLYRYAFSLRYDTVFVHMNEEYVLLCGPIWRLMGKKVVMWRNHKMGSWRTQLAVLFSSVVCHTSPDAYVAYSSKAVRMPIGIDTDFFALPQNPAPQGSVLFLGRLDPVKKVEVFVEALKNVKLPFRAELFGSPTEPGSAYAQRIEEMSKDVRSLGLFLGVPFAQTADLYRSHAVYVNITPSGSFDKTIGEAMACGSLVVCVNDVVQEVVPKELLARDGDVRDIARAIDAALALSAAGRDEVVRAQHRWVEEKHSLKALIGRLAELF